VVAIDTNVLVRFLAQDDPDQTRRAIELIESNRIWISLTVLLETEWVLRRTIRMRGSTVFLLLRAFVGLPNVIVEDEERLGKSLDLADAGMDFADALHITATDAGQRFATFDLDLIRLARRTGGAEAFTP
jgi:predicted nucleic-acid-binding protein